MFVPADDLEIMPANKIGNDYADYYVCTSSGLKSLCVNPSISVFRPQKSSWTGDDGDEFVWEPHYYDGEVHLWKCDKSDLYPDPLDGELEDTLTDWCYEMLDIFTERSDKYLSYLESNGIVKMIKSWTFLYNEEEAPFQNGILAWYYTQDDGNTIIALRICTCLEARSGENKYVYADSIDYNTQTFYGDESDEHIGRSIYESNAIEEVVSWIMNKVNEFAY